MDLKGRAIGLVLSILAFSHGGEGLWCLGFKTQGAYDFEPGNDFFIGPELGYSDLAVAHHRLQLKVSYLTNRLEQEFRENIVKQDYFFFTPIWHFRRAGFFDPTLQLDGGYTRYDVENEAIFGDLDNDTWLAALQVGLNVNLAKGAYGACYHFGYHFITPESSLVYPGVFGVEVWMML